MSKHLRSYQLAVNFYKATQPVQLPVPFKDQLNRAAAGIVLTLAEGTGRKTLKDQKRFFSMALGSIREIQTIFDLNESMIGNELHDQIDHLGASVYRLLQWKG